MDKIRNNKTVQLTLIVYAPIILAPILLFGKLLLRGEALFWGTPILQFIPWRAYAWKSLINGVFPMWNDLNGLGAPLMANYQVGLFYPPNWLLFLFAAIGGIPMMAWAHTILVIMHLIWAGLGTAMLIRKLGCGEISQSISGLAFSLSSYLVARSGFFSLVWTASWLPWSVLFLRELVIEEKSKSNTRTFFTAGLCMQLLAGHAQIAFYSILISVTWVLWEAKYKNLDNKLINKIIKIVIAGLLAGACAAIQLVPTFEYLLQSYRSASVDYETALTYSFWPWHLITFIAPDMFGNPGTNNYWGYGAHWEDAIYIGLSPLLLSLSTIPSIFKQKQQNEHFIYRSNVIRLLWAIALVCTIFALGKNTPVFPFLYRYILTFDMFNAPARWMIGTVFALTILAGFGAECWGPVVGRKLYWIRLMAAGFIAVTIGAFIAWIFLRQIETTFIKATALMGLWGTGFSILSLIQRNQKQNQKSDIWKWSVVLWVLADLLVAGWHLNPGIDSRIYKDKSSNTDKRNILEDQRIFLSPSDEYTIKFSRFFQFGKFSINDDWNNLRSILLPNLNLLDGIASVNNFDPLLPARYTRWVELHTLLSVEQKDIYYALMNVGLEEKIIPQSIHAVEFNPKVGGKRFRWYTSAVNVEDGDQSYELIVNMIEDKSFEEIEDKLIIEYMGNKENCTTSGNHAEIILIESRSDYIKLSIDTITDGWLFIADTWYPGWVGSVDAEPAEILRANYLFRAVRVPSGRHEVLLVYRPMSFYLGCMISIIGFLLLIYLILKNSPIIHHPDSDNK